MKFKTTDGDVSMRVVALRSNDAGETYLEFDFDNNEKIRVPCILDIDYITVVKNLVRRRNDP